MSSFSASIVHELPPDQVELIRSFLRNYNHQANPVWWERMEDPENDWKPLQVVIHGGEHEVVGGLLATTSMSWLRIQIMRSCGSICLHRFSRFLNETRTSPLSSLVSICSRMIRFQSLYLIA